MRERFRVRAAKIPARVLVPLIKVLQAELGEERANSLARQALGGMYRSLGEKWWRARHSDNLGQNMASAFEMYAAEHALEYTVKEQSQDAFHMNVTECRHAQFFKELGAPELGFLLVCSSDFHMAEGFGPDIELQCTQTIMRGVATVIQVPAAKVVVQLIGRPEVRPNASADDLRHALLRLDFAAIVTGMSEGSD
jgi:L-2-amino-thiazoline-4-carboxylic acid hydrolase